MEKVFAAALSLFTGPLIEGSFSEMTNIITSKRNSLDISTASAFQTVSYYLRASGKNAVSSFKRNDVATGPIDVKLIKKVQSSWKEQRKREAEAETESTSNDAFYGLMKKRSKKQTLEDTRAIYRSLLEK